ncbi:unnamed protein product [Sphenostylis stenocarpa]|uniref:Uncharacterized protein n=1 Tax=Sphenostylis stenocarpa TaxID=92480 RepID=A0AA86SC89_9FABA|nr:unnamed protein product [Sphenostylis stenocarpa]
MAASSSLEKGQEERWRNAIVSRFQCSNAESIYRELCVENDDVCKFMQKKIDMKTIVA